MPRAQQTMVAAGLRQAFPQPDQAAARAGLPQLGDQLHNRWRRLEGFIDESVEELERRADVVGIVPNEDSIARLTGAVLLEANDAWQLQHRYMQVEGMAELAMPMAKEQTLAIAPQAA